MKNLLFFLSILAAGSLFFYARQQTAHLTEAQHEAQQQEDQLNQQLSEKETELTALQAKLQKARSQSFQSENSPSEAPQANAGSALHTLSLQGATLDITPHHSNR